MLLGLALIGAPLRFLNKAHLLFSLGIVFILCSDSLVLHEQLSSAPWFAAPHPLWAIAGEGLGVPLTPSVSIVKNEPFYALGPSLAALLSLWCGLILGADRRVARQCLWVAAVSGALYALYGIVSVLIDPGSLLFRERNSFVGDVTGTFVNRNTAAAYFGICSVIWLLLSIERVRKALPEGFSKATSWKRVMGLKADRNLMLPIGGFCICLLALFMTGSRAGIVVSFAVLVIAIMAFIIQDRPGRRGIAFRLAIVIGSVVGFYFFLGGALDARFDMQGFGDGGRLATYGSTLRLIAAHPWFGSGLGTFEWAFPAYRSSDTSLWGIWDLAHSTPLELAVDLGIPFALLVGVAWFAMLWILARGFFIRRRDVAIPLAGFCVALIGLLHSCVDFSFQVTGFAIVAMAVVGAGIAQSFPSSPRHRRD
jgi:O-antigen ligase